MESSAVPTTIPEKYLKIVEKGLKLMRVQPKQALENSEYFKHVADTVPAIYGNEYELTFYAQLKPVILEAERQRHILRHYHQAQSFFLIHGKKCNLVIRRTVFNNDQNAPKYDAKFILFKDKEVLQSSLSEKSNIKVAFELDLEPDDVTEIDFEKEVIKIVSCNEALVEVNGKTFRLWEMDPNEREFKIECEDLAVTSNDVKAFLDKYQAIV